MVVSADNRLPSRKLFKARIDAPDNGDSRKYGKRVALNHEYASRYGDFSMINITVDDYCSRCYMGRDWSNNEPGSRFWLKSSPDARLMSSMIDECAGDHVECRQRTSERTLPARMIDVQGYLESETVHVVPGIECRNRMQESNANQ